MRLNIVMLLMHEQELCSCHLADSLQEKLSNVSRNLVLMRNKGVVTERREELWLHYRINDELPDWAKGLLEKVYQGNQERLAEPLAVLHEQQQIASSTDTLREGCRLDKNPKRDNDEHSVSMHT